MCLGLAKPVGVIVPGGVDLLEASFDAIKTAARLGQDLQVVRVLNLELFMDFSPESASGTSWP